MVRKDRNAVKAEERKAAARAAKSLLRDYKRPSRELGRKGRSMDIELYLFEQPEPQQPVLVFNHIKKTAGTSLRVSIHANLRHLEHLTERLPRDGDHHDWFADLYRRHGPRLACVAGHHGGIMLAVVEDRPTQGFVMLRDAVDRVLSRYYFMAGHNQRRGSTISWTPAGFFGSLEENPENYNAREGMCNGQARALLESHYDHSDLPLLPDHPDTGLWRQRLFDLVDEHYVVGVQSRFSDSVDLFAARFGWENRRAETVRRNRNRPADAKLTPETEALVRRYNWLDDDLYKRELKRFGSGTGKRGLRRLAR
jgi:hypothetical protein